MDVAANLRAARRRAGLTQAELAKRAGTSQATLSAYERGRKRPSIDTLARLLDGAGSRLAVRTEPRKVREPSPRDHAQTAVELLEVLALAAALPTEHSLELRYPRLPA